VDSTSSHRYAVILAGGSGTRLWPLSTANNPKQLLKPGGELPLVVDTFVRLAQVVPEDHIYVSTTQLLVDELSARLPQVTPDRMIVEPHGEGKAAAYYLISRRLSEVDPAATMLTAASDSVVFPLEGFVAGCRAAFEHAEQMSAGAALLGVRPMRADTTLGYVRTAAAPASYPAGLMPVVEFQEKPSAESASDFAADPAWYWNTSHYCVSVDNMMDAYRRAAPEMCASIDRFLETDDPASYSGRHAPAHELSPFVDLGIQIDLVAGGFEWHDVGTWPSLHRALSARGDDSVIVLGLAEELECSGTLVFNESSMQVVALGLEDVVVAVSESTALIASLALLEKDPGALARARAKIQAPLKRDPGL
jgi:mannose-1-phosphate guanylyltransferase